MLIISIILNLLLAWNWRIDHVNAIKYAYAIEACIHQYGFIVKTPAKEYIILCAWGEHYKSIEPAYPYEIMTP